MKKYSVVFAADEHYVQHLAVALVSLLENNRDLMFNIYIISGGINPKTYSRLLQSLSEYDSHVTSIEIDDEKFSTLVVNAYFSKANYYRLLIPDLIKEPKVLYLDSDIIVNGSIKALYEYDVSDDYIAAIESPVFSRHDELKMQKESAYFNSGVMLINVERWRTDNIPARVINFIDENRPAIHFVDQCGLNAVIDGKWKKLPPKFNQQLPEILTDSPNNVGCFSIEEIEEAVKTPVIIHFIGSSKPWHFRNWHPHRKLYWKYLKMTPFYPYIPVDFTPLNVIIKFMEWAVPFPVKQLIKKFFKHYKTKPRKDTLNLLQ